VVDHRRYPGGRLTVNAAAMMIWPSAQSIDARGPGPRRRSGAGFVVGLLGVVIATNASAATFDCVLNPALTVKVGSPVTSVLAEVLVDRGDVVKKGDPLARIESAVEQAAVAVNEVRASSTAEIEAKQAVLEQKSGEIKRKLELQARNAESQKNVDTAQAEFNVAKADVTMAELAHRMAQLELDRSRALLEQRTIRSPFDGVVVERALGPGEFVRMDANIVTLAKIH
jgi:RND family efflux transporter MFP subunit